MNVITTEIVLLLVRHGLTAGGFERVWHDPEFNQKITGFVVMVVGVAWSVFRKVKRHSKQLEVNPIPPVPPAKS